MRSSRRPRRYAQSSNTEFRPVRYGGGSRLKPRRIGHYIIRLLRSDNTAKRLTTEDVASAQSAAMLKSAVRLCCKATANLRAALAWARASSLTPPDNSRSKNGLQHPSGIGFAHLCDISTDMTRRIKDRLSDRYQDLTT